MRKLNIKSNKITKGSQVNSFVGIFLTSIAWTIILSIVTWAIAALGWFAIGVIWKRQLFLPQNIKDTAIALILLGLWLLVIFTFFALWKRYNYNKYYLHNKRSVEPLIDTPEPLKWKELNIDPGSESSKTRGG
ncbi:hypothetical protein [Coprothermobacter platensis]|uniref:hypothetical protein n=1 Tax=Coprothermobacter platensis TaxID=108819 RepID=UPI0012E9ACB0|nr:hypothetical protein [Coprothermobacter platensis]